MAKILIERESQFISRMRSYKILANGKELGSIKDGEMREFPMEPGEYSLQLQIDWCKSKQIKVNIQQDGIIKFKCGSRMKWWQAGFASLSKDKLDEFVYLDLVE